MEGSIFLAVRQDRELVGVGIHINQELVVPVTELLVVIGRVCNGFLLQNRPQKTSMYLHKK